MPELDLERCQKGFEELLKLFQLRIETESEEVSTMLELVEQLTVIIMALSIQHNVVAKNHPPIDIIQKAWSASGIDTLCPISINVETMHSVQDNAFKASNDDSQLYGLYQNFMGHAISLLRMLMATVPKPSNMDNVRELKKESVNRSGEYDIFVPRELNTTWFRCTGLTVGKAPGLESNQLKSLQPLSLALNNTGEHSYNDIGKGARIIDGKATANDNESDLTGNSSREHSISDAENPVKPSESISSSSSIDIIETTHEGEEGSDRYAYQDMPNWLDQVFESTGSSSRLSHDVESIENVDKEQNIRDIGDREETQPLASSSPVTAAAGKEQKQDTLSTQGRILKTMPTSTAKKSIGLLARVINKTRSKPLSDSEFEDDGEVPPIERKRKRAPTPPSTSHHDSEELIQHSSGSSSNHTPSTLVQQTLSPIPPNHSVRPCPAPAKVRKQNRPWTSKEIGRLMELVPRFQHKTSETSGTKYRKIQWSKLKRYDSMNGNILEHRTDVMLKDKYREKTDNGHHRQQVNQILGSKRSKVLRYQFHQPRDSLL
ncbi:hypothetical protein BGZ76_001215 [Entomortierella beljakovae]|nr:hypothetical protein BGZ76_001215 [Entomortierella beljakovae]